jgi:hypothetical protein
VQHRIKRKIQEECETKEIKGGGGGGGGELKQREVKN